MCGFFAAFKIEEKGLFSIEEFENGLKKIRHRGPDSINLCSFPNAFMGHVRLSIIDLEDRSNQPMKHNELTIVFNGEIFNYRELRDELINLGHNFVTAGDTEVLLHAYEEWGEDFLGKLNGMWSFVIYDESNHSIFASRDRFGIKPFNYAFHGGFIYFFSEIKSFLEIKSFRPKPNYEIISGFLKFSVGAEEENTWFDGIKRLQPGHKFSGTVNNDLYPKPYYSIVQAALGDIVPIGSYKEIWEEAVQLRLRTDVPLGMTVSSGLDSTSILVTAAKFCDSDNINIYTASFDPKKYSKSEKSAFNSDVEIDEYSVVKKLCQDFGYSSNKVEVNYENYTSKLQRIIYHLESGNSSPAVFPLDQILETAARDVTVILEGQGADELLGGYISSIYPIYLKDLLFKFKLGRFYSELRYFRSVYSLKFGILMLLRNSDWNFFRTIYFWKSGIGKSLGNELRNSSMKFKRHFKSKELGRVRSFLISQHQRGLVNLLHYGDALSMKHSLESRLPFMDVALVEKSIKLSSNMLIREGFGKWIHREALKGELPEEIRLSKYKFGFESPVRDIFDSEREDSPRTVLQSERFKSRNIFNFDSIQFMLNNLDKNDVSRYLYRVLSVELWFRIFIDE